MNSPRPVPGRFDAPAESARLECAAPAKINLYLHVLGQRDDGYHLIDSLVAFAGLGDVLRLEAADALTLRIEGALAASRGLDENIENNLVMRAARGLAEAGGYAAGAAITLVKYLPVAAGLGGGSSDAASALHGLNALWKLGAATDDLREIALSLGADVPVCLHGAPAFVGGIGEEIAPAPSLPHAWLVLVNPGAKLSTADVYRACDGKSAAARFVDVPGSAAELAQILATRANDLAAPACRIEPRIAPVLDAIGSGPDCLLARLSGSGATCFGLYVEEDAARRDAQRLSGLDPNWWVAATPMSPPEAEN